MGNFGGRVDFLGIVVSQMCGLHVFIHRKGVFWVFFAAVWNVGMVYLILSLNVFVRYLH